MSRSHSPPPWHPDDDVPEEVEPGAPPVEPDEGPVPAFFPGDPEHERVLDPGARPPEVVGRDGTRSAVPVPGSRSPPSGSS